MALLEPQPHVSNGGEDAMAVWNFREEREVGAMITLLILATIGAIAGGIGGAFTNGLNGFILGGCAGFILGVVTWITDSMAENRRQELHSDQFMSEFDQATFHQPPTERSHPS